eukprot:TRINITY_DN3389_c0_g1_i1.p1 TRINITY_DN3389_c0_g1~~TRINITY_DN3389_c0_g1_i1.p1  ORF type:complete len:200 (-),score=32.37 TRINITY_DN3389_c0_g1_i1:66-665(-)
MEPWDISCKREVPSWKRKVVNVFNILNLSVGLIFIQTVYWVGWWNLLAYWAWPWGTTLYVERDILYIVMGVCLKFVGVMWLPEESPSFEAANAWSEGHIPATFEWRRKFKNYLVSMVHFLAFLFVWVGAWNVFDLYLYNCGYCWERELWYITIPAVLLFIFQEFLSKESVLWMCAKGNPFSARYDIESQDEETPLTKPK